MGKKHALSSLRLRNGIWYIEKMVDGTRLYESTGVSRTINHNLKIVRQISNLAYKE